MDKIDSRFFVPFEHGWTREVVKRRIGHIRDVYYYSPTKIKLRSTNEVFDYFWNAPVKNLTLTVDNFTFIREPLGLRDTKKEIIRTAIKKKKKKKKKKRTVAKKTPHIENEQSSESESETTPAYLIPCSPSTCNCEQGYGPDRRKMYTSSEMESEEEDDIQMESEEEDDIQEEPTSRASQRVPQLVMPSQEVAHSSSMNYGEQQSSNNQPQLVMPSQEVAHSSSMNYGEQQSSNNQPQLVMPSQEVAHSSSMNYGEQQSSNNQVTEDLFTRNENSSSAFVTPRWYLMPGEHPEEKKGKKSNEVKDKEKQLELKISFVYSIGKSGWREDVGEVVHVISSDEE